MARKKAAGANGAATAEAPALTIDEIKKRLIEKGKKRGSLTNEEINIAFDNVEDISAEAIDELFEEIMGLGINIVDEEKEEKSEPEEGAAAETALSVGLSLDDPVRMYLKEIGRVPLLSMEDEKNLAMKIEAGENETKKNGEANGVIVFQGDEA